MTVCGQLAGLGLERGGEFIIFGDSIRQCADKTSQCESGWPWVVSAGHFLSTLRRSLARSLTLSKSFCSLSDFSSRSLSRSCWAFSCFSSCFFLDSAMVLSKTWRRIIYLFLLDRPLVMPAIHCPVAPRSLG